MKRPPKLKEMDMNTRSLLTLGTTTLVAATLNLTAADAFLSPRAAASVIPQVAGVNRDANLLAQDTAVALSPRAASNQIKTVASVRNDVNLALMCRKVMTASPKAIAVCAANPVMPCCEAVVASANP